MKPDISNAFIDGKCVDSLDKILSETSDKKLKKRICYILAKYMETGFYLSKISKREIRLKLLIDNYVQIKNNIKLKKYKPEIETHLLSTIKAIYKKFLTK